MILGTDFEVLSEYPLWTYDENDKPVLIQNTYDNINVIRYWPMGKKNHHFYDIPIEEPITAFMPFGTFFFKTQEECARFGKLIDSQEGKQTVLENSYECSRKNKHIVKMNCRDEIPNGIYSAKVLDDIIIADELFNLRYVDEECKIKEIMQANETINKYIKEYMTMFAFTERHNLQYERVLFELYKEGNKLYINHVFISCGSYFTNNDILLHSRIMNYPICVAPNCAKTVQIVLTNGGFNALSMQERQISLKNIKDVKARKERHKHLAKNIAKMCGEYAWEHKGEIFMKIKNLATAII